MTESKGLKSTPQGQTKKTGGGAAFGGGANFQASLTAIVGAHILHGTPLGWLDGVCDDRPVAVWAESEGPGDDLRIELTDGCAIEVQAKKGLSRSDNLWISLLALAKAIHNEELSYGILAVASDASITIKKDLADDLERIGQGRVDRLTEIGGDFLARLTAEDIPAENVCRSLRIRVIDTLLSNDRDIIAAKDVLREVCAHEEDASAAFDVLSHRAMRLIENRGRWTLHELVRLLKTRGIKLRNDSSPAALLSRYAQWVCDTHNDFAIVGAPRRIPIEHLLPMQLEHRAFELDEAADALAALERYQTVSTRQAAGDVFDSLWTGRFRKRAVVVAGPGLGKSTMLKELAHRYALDGFMVLTAPLKWIAAGMQTGKAFSDLLITRSFDGSGIVAGDVINDKRFSWVVLLDALDECGQDHAAIAEEIRRFSVGHPDARIVVTTRPIGYTSNALSDWLHYSLLPPRVEEGRENLVKFLKAIAPDEPRQPESIDLPKDYDSHDRPKNGFAISPQLLGMSAVLIQRNRALPGTRVKLYSELMKLFEEAPIKARTADGVELTDIAIQVLAFTGWYLLENPLLSSKELVERVAEGLAPLVEKTAFTCRNYVRISLSHWERVGLVETFYHGGTPLIAFIHKTFCEFVAARYLSDQSLDTIEATIDHAEKNELINFGVGLGLADKLIDLHLQRHARGQSDQIPHALALLSKPEVVVSSERVKKLIHQAFRAIDERNSDMFAIGVALADLRGQVAETIETEAARRLQSSDPAIKLVAWALIANAGKSDLGSVAAMNELARHSPPFNPASIFGEHKEDRSDLELLRRLALGALSVQPDSQARDFAERELSSKVFFNIGFIFEINRHLESRGISPLSTPFDRPPLEAATVARGVVNPSFDDATRVAICAIAQAFVPRDFCPSALNAHDSVFPQLSGFLRASGYMEMSAGDIFRWGSPREDVTARSTLRYIASVLPVDLESLQQECCELLDLHAAGDISIFDILAHVDIPKLTWPQDMAPPFELTEIKQAILHPSEWLSRLAACICDRFPMTDDELEALLEQSSGHSLRHVLSLAQRYHSGELVDLAWRRLQHKPTGDVSSIFALLLAVKMHPSPELMDITLASLCSESKETGNAAAQLLKYWRNQGVSLNRERIEKAVAHWGGREATKRLSVYHTPLHSIIELSDSISN